MASWWSTQGGNCVRVLRASPRLRVAWACLAGGSGAADLPLTMGQGEHLPRTTSGYGVIRGGSPERQAAQQAPAAPTRETRAEGSTRNTHGGAVGPGLRTNPQHPRETPSAARNATLGNGGRAKCRYRPHQRGTVARIGAPEGARFAVA